MKKLITVLFILAVSTNVFSVDRASKVNYHKNVSTVTAIGDVSSEYCAEVDGNGSLQIAGFPIQSASLKVADGVANTSNTACTLQGVIMSGVTAGDYVLIYDGGIEETNAGDWPVLKMDVPVGVAYTPSVVMIPQGLAFTKELYVDLHLTGNGNAQVFYTE